MIKKLKRAAITLLVAFPVVVFSAAWYFSSLLLYPELYPCDEEHYVFCESPAQIDLEYEDVTLNTKDGFDLDGWFLPGQNPKAGIVLIHGRGATRHSGLRDAIALHQAGFPMLLIDLRNSGTSQSSYNTMGYLEQLDVHAAVARLKEMGMEKIGVVGYSMGATTSILAMADNSDIDAGWFDSGFKSLDGIIVERGREDYAIPLVEQFSKVVRFIYRIRGGFDDSRTPENVIASISPRPIMIVHGTADKTVSVEHGRALYAAAQEPKQYWEIPGGEHTRAWQADKTKSADLISHFFENALSK